MLDSCRHFQSAAFIKSFIDDMVLHKLNVFHWHLTDDQGWRIEIKRYPRLTSVGSMRKETRVGHENDPKGFDGKPHGGFYTQAEIRNIVAYARDRFVTIVPEIEMPGHAQAAIAAYPELGNTSEKVEVGTVWGIYKNVFNVDESTIVFLQNVLTETLALFPGKFIHVGGDEVLKDQWKASPTAQARMKELAAPLAGEMSGHVFFGERWYGFDDATYTAARLLEILSRARDPSAILNALPEGFSTPELNVPCAEGEPARVVERLRAEAKFPGAREIVTIDGVRVEYKDGFGLIRASNTTPVLVLRFEGATPGSLARIQADCMAALRAVKPDAQVAAAAH